VDIIKTNNNPLLHIFCDWIVHLFHFSQLKKNYALKNDPICYHLIKEDQLNMLKCKSFKPSLEPIKMPHQNGHSCDIHGDKKKNPLPKSLASQK